MTTTEARSGPGDDLHTIEAVARRLYSEVWNEGRYDVAAELIHPDFSYAVRPDLRGPAAKLAAIRMHRVAFPDARFTIEELIVVPDRVAVRTSVTGTDTGGLPGRLPSGRAVATWSVEFLGFRDGLIVSDWVGADWLGILVQAGAVADPWTV